MAVIFTEPLYRLVRSESPYRCDQVERRCSECGGAGEVRTDLDNGAYYAVLCVACRGRGWVPHEPEG